MEKFQFTTQGFAALCQHLAALSDADLALVATAARTDLKHWTTQYFDLTAAQQLYLEELPSAALQFMADQTSFAIGNIRTLLLAQPTVLGKRASKLFKTTATLAAVISSTGELIAEGELLLTISYA